MQSKCLEPPCSFLERERAERLEADAKHEKSLEELKTGLASQTRILAVVVAAATMGAQLLDRILATVMP